MPNFQQSGSRQDMNSGFPMLDTNELDKDRSVIVVASDARLRASIVNCISWYAYTVPVEDTAELERYWPGKRSMLVVHDEGDAIEKSTELMTQRGDWLPLIAVSSDRPIERVVDAIRAGACDYWRLPIDPDTIAARLPEAIGRTTAERKRQEHRALALKRISRLSPREREVMNGMAFGFSNKEIAQVLGISPRTVEIHRANVIYRLDARSTSAVVRLFTQAELD